MDLFRITGHSDEDDATTSSNLDQCPSQLHDEPTQLDDSEFVLPTTSKKRKRSPKTDEIVTIKFVRKKANVRAKLPAHMNYTVEGIKTTWNAETDYGASFRNMDPAEQVSEVKRLNKGAEKGLKGVIKTKLIDSNYSVLVRDRMRAYLSDSRLPIASMFHAPANTTTSVQANPNFISVGEWVEVDADRTPGFNSEGGIAVIIGVHDDLADVK
jgi:hypothetical protein